MLLTKTKMKFTKDAIFSPRKEKLADFKNTYQYLECYNTLWLAELDSLELSNKLKKLFSWEY